MENIQGTTESSGYSQQTQAMFQPMDLQVKPVGPMAETLLELRLHRELDSLTMALAHTGFAGDGSIAAQKSTDKSPETPIFVPLFHITIGNPEGITLTPASRDLNCFINEAEVEQEINLDSGTKVSVAERELLIVEGPLPRVRRKLPNPPGSPLVNRLSKNTEEDVESPPQVNEDSLMLLSEWQMVNKPIIDSSVVENFETPDQISNFTASLICKQIQLFTDASLSFDKMDSIFKFFKKISSYSTNVLLQFLKDMNRAVQNMKEEDRDICPIHGPILSLLINVMKLHLDLVNGVLLCLQLLRTFSHFPANHQVLVELKGVATILGAMAAYKTHVDIQTNGMDVIANMATYKPKVHEKAPVRETVIEMILHTIKNHRECLDIIQRGCRILSNTCVMNFELVNHLIETETLSFELKSLIKRHVKILDYAEKLGIPFIQSSLEEYNGDINVRTEGRRFLFIYSKTHHLKQKVRSFLRPLKYDETSLESNCSLPPLVTTELISDNSKGILKKSGSYENLRNPEKKLKFADSESSCDSDSYTSSDMDAYESRDVIISSVPLQDDKSLEVVPMAISVEQEIGSYKYSKDKSETTEEFSKESVDTLDGDISDSDSDIIMLESTDECMIQESFQTSDHKEEMNKDYMKNSEENEDSVLTNSSETIPTHLFADSFLEKMQKDQQDQNKNEVHVSSFEKMHDISSLNNISAVPAQHPFSSTHPVSAIDMCGGKVPLLENIPQGSLECKNCAMSHHTQSSPNNKDSDIDIQDLVKDKTCWSDVKFTQLIVKSEVCFHVCLMMLQGHDSDALQIMDQPLRKLLPGYNPKQVLLHRFVEEQYSPDVTFVDLDPSLVISIIDASRYRSLAHNLVQDMMSNLTKSLRDVVDSCILSIGINCIKSALYNELMEAVWKDSEFLVDYSALFSDVTKLFSTLPEVLEIKKRLVMLH